MPLEWIKRCPRQPADTTEFELLCGEEGLAKRSVWINTVLRIPPPSTILSSAGQRPFRHTFRFGPDPLNIMALDTSRSTALSWEFPPPRWAQGLSTGIPSGNGHGDTYTTGRLRTSPDNYQSIGNLFYNTIKTLWLLGIQRNSAASIPSIHAPPARRNSRSGRISMAGLQPPTKMRFPAIKVNLYQAILTSSFNIGIRMSYVGDLTTFL